MLPDMCATSWSVGTSLRKGSIKDNLMIFKQSVFKEKREYV